jgi:DNA-binding transcriptional LysR family regulator
MPTSQLRYFEEVVRSGSIRLAADRLRIAPSAISRQIRNIEQELGTPLFERHARGVVLTSAGEIYASYARSALSERDRIRAEIDDLKGLRRGHIRLCTAEGIVDELMGNIADFRTGHPGVTFQVTVVGSQHILPLVRAGDVDLGITYTADVEAGIGYLSRRRAPLYAVMHRSHPLAGAIRLKFSATMAHPIAIPDKTFGVRRLLDAQCQSSRLVMRPVLESSSINALRAFARAGGGVTFLPIVTVRSELERATIAAVALSDATLRKGTLDICVAADRKPTNATAAFVAHLQRALLKVDDANH